MITTLIKHNMMDDIVKIIILMHLANTISGCQVTVPYQMTTKARGETAILEWDIYRPYNYLFNSMSCYKMRNENEKEIQLVQGVANKLRKTSKAPERMTFVKKNTRHIIQISDIQYSDAGVYKCFVTCISAKPFHYEQKIELIVEGADSKKTTTETSRKNKGKNTKTATTKDGEENADGDPDENRKKLMIAVGVTSGVLLILVIALIVVCARKKYYKSLYRKSKDNEKASQNNKKSQHDAGEFHEQQYADLTDFQQNNYGELDAKLELWHNYEYVDNALVVPKKKTSIVSATYECVNPKTPFRKVSRDLV